MVTVSPDTVEATRRLKDEKNLGMTMLSDPDLEVTERYNVLHENTLAPDPNRSFRRPLAIPTTFFFNEKGRLEWIDQAEDYRVRSDADRVLAAVQNALST